MKFLGRHLPKLEKGNYDGKALGNDIFIEHKLNHRPVTDMSEIQIITACYDYTSLGRFTLKDNGTMYANIPSLRENKLVLSTTLKVICP